MSVIPRLVAALLAGSLAAAACSPASEGSKDIGGPPPTTTSTTTTTTTTTVPAPTFAIEVVLDDDPEARDAVQALYAWVGDRSLPEPHVPPGLLTHLAGITPDRDAVVFSHIVARVVDGVGRIAVVTAEDDVVLLADDGEGWRVVGAALARFDVDPWYGEPVRHVLIIGTDARPGQSQPHYRADAISLLSSNLPERRGAVVGVPRDTYVQASYGMDKFSSVNARSDRHADEMLEVARDLTGLPIEGYLLTGFVGFRNLINEFGGVVVNVPYRMDDWRAEADLHPGIQRLFGDDALAFTRIRSIPGGDFGRSANHGVFMLAVMAELADRDVTRLPELVSILRRNTWTDLALGDLLTLAAVGLLLEPEDVTTLVLPGQVRMVSGMSVVLLDEERVEEIFTDLQGGLLSD